MNRRYFKHHGGWVVHVYCINFIDNVNVVMRVMSAGG